MLEVKEKNSILSIQIQRPEVRNAFNPELIAQITESFEQASLRKDIRLAVLSGQGKVFCAGADLNWMRSMVQFSQEENQKDSLKLFDMFEAIRDCPFPVLTQVQGAAFGGALGLIAASDYVIADQKTQFCFSEVKLGIAPAVISAFVLEKCSQAHVSPMMISGKVFGSEDAIRMGLVHEVVDSSQLEGATQKVIDGFLACGPQALRETKSLVRKVSLLSWEQARIETASVIAKLRTSPEGQEGLKSFLEKREASWRLK